MYAGLLISIAVSGKNNCANVALVCAEDDEVLSSRFAINNTVADAV